mgnify:CR=1 FL=1
MNTRADDDNERLYLFEQEWFDGFDLDAIAEPIAESPEPDSEELFHEFPFDLDPGSSSFEDQLKELLLSKKSSFSDPEKFVCDVSMTFDHQVSKVLEEVFPRMVIEEILKLSFFFQHHPFFLNTIAEVIKKKQPYANHFDEANQILQSYQEYLINGYLRFPPEDPPFGTIEQWMDLCDSLQDLYQGKPDAYIQHMLTFTQ